MGGEEEAVVRLWRRSRLHLVRQQIVCPSSGSPRSQRLLQTQLLRFVQAAASNRACVIALLMMVHCSLWDRQVGGSRYHLVVFLLEDPVYKKNRASSVHDQITSIFSEVGIPLFAELEERSNHVASEQVRHLTGTQNTRHIVFSSLVTALLMNSLQRQRWIEPLTTIRGTQGQNSIHTSLGKEDPLPSMCVMACTECNKKPTCPRRCPRNTAEIQFCSNSWMQPATSGTHIPRNNIKIRDDITRVVANASSP